MTNPPGAFTTPTIEYVLAAPMLVVLVGALLGVLVEAFATRGARRVVQPVVGLASVAVAVVALLTVTRAHVNNVGTSGSIAVDIAGLFLQGTILVLSFLALLVFVERRIDSAGDPFAASAATTPGGDQERELTAAGVLTTEVWPLALFSIGGMMLFVVANDLLTMFVALEVMSLPLYLLVGLARRRRLLSQEAALKYFLLGSFSSAFFLFGSALLFGYADSLRFSDIAAALGTRVGLDAVLLLGAALVGVGLLFKVGAVPFHSWVPDVYQGAPTPVTSLMAAAVKVAAFGALLRVFYVALANYNWDWRPFMWGVAILTMVVASIVAITQTDIKRMLAYSSVAQVGFIMTGFIATSVQGMSSTLFYLAAYGFATIGAFTVVMLVRDAGGEATHLSRWAGLGRRSPLVASVLALFLLAFAGIPLTSGFTAKFAVFTAAADGGAVPLVVVGVVMSAVAAFFYIRVIVLMFFSDPAEDGPTVAVPNPLTSLSIVVAVVMTIALGVFPQPVLQLAQDAATLVR